ncbi:MAG: enolase C-terminal domain-like protein [Bryobacteraceae bacterium]
MQRRDFLTAMSVAAGAPRLGLAFAPGAHQGKLKISGIEVWRVEGHAETPLSQLYLTVKTDAGLDGLYGPMDEASLYFLERQFAPRLAGQDPLAVEAIWDRLFHASDAARGKAFMAGLSAIDNALWDLRGRYFEQPVYSLLGGPTRVAVDVYAGCQGFSHAPAALRERVQALARDGFTRQKWFFTRVPADGLDGLAENVALARQVREMLGDDADIMFDCHAGWNLDYAIEWARQAETFRPRWLEEPFPPEQLESFARLRHATSIPIASGEHLYDRWRVHDYLEAWALNIAQPDPEWCGGISEVVRICAIASLYDVQVMPHSTNLRAGLHAVASQSPGVCPLLEYPVAPIQRRMWFEKNPPRPVAGKIALDAAPGFGIELDETRIERKSRVLAV